MVPTHKDLPASLITLGICLLAAGVWFKFDFSVFMLFLLCLLCWNTGFLKGLGCANLTKK